MLDGASGAITDDVHSAFGDGSTIDNGATTDNNGDTYSSDCILTVAETNTDPAGRRNCLDAGNGLLGP